MAEPGRSLWALLPTGAAAAAGTLAWLAGVDGGHVATLALAAAAAGSVAAWPGGAGPGAWPDPPPGGHGAGWHQVTLVAASLLRAEQDPSRVESLVDRRLRALAAASQGGDDPAVRAALRAPGPPTARVRAVLDALEAAARAGGGRR